jgi:hypothetical protein
MAVVQNPADAVLAAKLRQYADRTSYVYKEEIDNLRLAADRIDGRQTDRLLEKVVADYDRRRATRWGRFLLWLLRKTT